ncbi:hypothetical protein B5807_09185 [Epicoccum nigrum]|uniref:DUF1763-domain-containing protein n=1 Tax=Epicoccum nigrum TaxID=105696 RepID=A0A1Y2LPS9_EPING|nr:hypothetical protein B5807_09185 [Epicoccum nigrum]
MPNEAIVHAYRHVLRHSLRAIQFSKPARYTLRDRLRAAFRKGTANDFDQLKITNTLEFLHYAARENGLEHKIVKNLLFVWWCQDKGTRTKGNFKLRAPEQLEIRTTAFDSFNHNIRMLNESMGTCIPCMTLRYPSVA